MVAPSGSNLTTSFVKLRRLAVSFDRLRDGKPTEPAEERAILRVTRQLGATALRLLERELGSPHEERARWAHALLAHTARNQELCARIASDLRRLVGGGGAADLAKLRALTLLAELGADLPGEAQLADPDAARRRSLRELALCLATPAEIARAADHLLEELAFDDILDLFDDLAGSEPTSALLLIDELLVRDELDEACRRELRQRRATASQSAAPLAPRATARRAAPRTRFARHSDGRRILLASGRQLGSRPPRMRLLCVLVGADDSMLDGYYAEDLTAAEIAKRFSSPLAEQGFAFATCSLEAARGFVIQAARIAVQSGRTLPRAFYLGRDLIGLRDEHLDGTPRSRGEMDLAALLERAIELIAAGEPAQARPLCERYVAEVPDDPDGHAQLGLCALGLGDADAALHHLGRATWLTPEEPLYQWNAAAAAHAARRPGACYLSLLAYLQGDTSDGSPGAAHRAAVALGFVSEYERLAQLEHPGQSARELAIAESGHLVSPPRPKPRRRRRARN
jgi:hypothetical protein